MINCRKVNMMATAYKHQNKIIEDQLGFTKVILPTSCIFYTKISFERRVQKPSRTFNRPVTVSYIFEGMHKINQSHSRDDGHKNKVLSPLILKLCIDKNQTKL